MSRSSWVLLSMIGVREGANGERISVVTRISVRISGNLAELDCRVWWFLTVVGIVESRGSPYLRFKGNVADVEILLCRPS
jgi:hypothetical protein